MLIDDKKIKDMTGKATPLNDSLKKSTDTISQLNQLGTTANTFLEKILAFKNSQQLNQESGQFQAKINKGINQQITSVKQQRIIIDDVKAMIELDEIVKKIPADWLEKKLKDLKPEYEKNKEMIKPFVIEFVRRSVRLE